MKILIVASCNKSRFSPFVVEQAQALQRKGVDVDFYGIVGKGMRGYLKTLVPLLRKIREFHPDLIHAHYGLSGIIAVMQNKVPVVTTFHNGETLSKGVNFLSSLASLRAKYVIYVAQHIYDLCYFKAKNYSILPCGVCLEDCKIIPKEQAREMLGLELEKKYILFGGAFDNLRKNYPLLQQAVQLMKNKENIVCWEMKGLSRAECVLRMCACEVFALPTISEGSPQALKEAMACNCPIVATDVADIRHLLGDLPGHFILENKNKTKEKWVGDENSACELADCLRKALDFKRRTRGRERIETLGLDNEQVVQKLIQIYNNILNKV